MPVILAFDTSGPHLAVALICADGRVVQRFEPMEKGQGEHLFALVDTVLAEGGVAWRDLTALAVGTGPGNFTGVRIAVAAVRGLALALGIPAHGVTRFQALALDQPHPLAVVEDARRGEVYLQERNPDPEPARLTDLASLPLEIGNLPLTGSAAEAAAALTGAKVLPPRFPLAEAIARVALAHPIGAAVPPPAPCYLRGADAAPPADPPPVILNDA